MAPVPESLKVSDGSDTTGIFEITPAAAQVRRLEIPADSPILPRKTRYRVVASVVTHRSSSKPGCSGQSETSPGWSPGCYIQGLNGISIGDYTQVAANVGADRHRTIAQLFVTGQVAGW